jgi:uncharacterized protein with NRDE domain
MCFVLLLYRVHPRYPIVVAANREERRDRPASPPHAWDTSPRIWAGRDEVAGGTWLGLNELGLVVAITNRRAEANDPNAPSRGALCLGALHQPTAAAARRYLTAELARQPRFNAFNLIALDGEEAWVATRDGQVTNLAPGIHVIVSQGDVDDPRLARVRRGQRLARRLHPATRELPELLSGLATICANQTKPDPICRPGGQRGTVSSSLIALDRDGQVAAYWHAPGPPNEHAYDLVDVNAPTSRLTVHSS